MEDQQLGFWKRTAIYLGFADEPVEERAELPIMGSPNQPLSAVDLSPNNTGAVSTDRAMSLAGVYRAVSILGSAVSQLDLGVWRNGEELDLSTSSIIAKPNLDISRQAFLEQTAISLATNGNAFWLLRRNSPQASVGSVEVLDPNHVYVETDDKGKTVYRYHGKTYQKWQIKHLWLMRLPGYNRGVGPIQAAQNELRGSLDLRNYADNWFRESGIPNGILKTDQVLTAEQAAAYSEEWHRKQAARQTAVLGQGVSYQPVYLSPADAQFIESQNFSMTQIARMFGIPATHLLTGVEGNSMTYTNVEQVDIAFVRYTLTKYLNEIEQAFSELLPRGQEARFKVEALLRGDQKTRFDGYKTALEAGFLTINEVRAKEGLLPLPDGDKPAPVVSSNKEDETE